MLVLTTLSITPCSHFREPSDNFGNSIGRTSTFPGPTYTTPRLLAINVRSFKNLECFGSSFRYSGPRSPELPLTPTPPTTFPRAGDLGGVRVERGMAVIDKMNCRCGPHH